jgi:hypothetical protein
MAQKARKQAALPAPIQGVIWLTRSQAASRSGLTESGLRARVRLRLLNEYRDDINRPRYDAAEVDALARKRPVNSKAVKAAARDEGAISAQAFALFRGEGIDLRLAVEQLGVTLDVADGLARDYARAGKETLLLLREPTGTTLRDMLDWRGSDEESLVRAIVADRDRRRDAHGADVQAARDKLQTTERLLGEANQGIERAAAAIRVRDEQLQAAARELHAAKSRIAELERQPAEAPPVVNTPVASAMNGAAGPGHPAKG